MHPDNGQHPGNPRVRFVILHHVRRDDDHFDLMIDRGETLATWQCPTQPGIGPPAPMDCRRIADHRRSYLDYEGPISGDRGSVKRQDAGWCTVEITAPDDWLMTFDGTHLRGRYRLCCTSDGGSSWRLSPAS